MCGHLPAPDISYGQYLVDILFKIGPTRGDLPLSEGDLEPWERRRGIELSPWQAEILVEMSQAYLGEMHQAGKPTALCPWPKGAKAWQKVQGVRAEQERKAAVEAQQSQRSRGNDSSKRHRNPSSR